MTTGTPIGRHCILVLRDGNIVIDWGSGTYQDLVTGEPCPITESSISHTILEAELAWLKQTGLVSAYDEQQAYIIGLPENASKSPNESVSSK